ncbi:hypothetical protein C8R47DRAFT_1084768 [Mycena vitilis]|nr:hypothetical protein C8R47DRAFT_1264572 [Mycena vitilis]KAJ6449312.1 hypothetical protein C8R47DRAFT_1084768 [Mycena vitilis]
MDPETQAALVKLHHRFIDEHDFKLNYFHEGLNQLLPDQASAEWKAWHAHGASLITAWEIIVKDGGAADWPLPPFSSETGSEPNALDQLTGENERAVIRAQRKMDASGVLPAPGEVGPVRHAKSIFAQRIEDLEKEAKGKTGRRRDFLADECVIVGTHTVIRRAGKSEEDKCTYCVGCDRKAAGHDPTRIKSHAFQCQKLQAEWPELWALVNTERGGASLSTALEEGNTSALPTPEKLPAEDAGGTVGFGRADHTAKTVSSACGSTLAEVNSFGYGLSPGEHAPETRGLIREFGQLQTDSFTTAETTAEHTSFSCDLSRVKTNGFGNTGTRA